MCGGAGNPGKRPILTVNFSTLSLVVGGERTDFPLGSSPGDATGPDDDAGWETDDQGGGGVATTSTREATATVTVLGAATLVAVAGVSASGQALSSRTVQSFREAVKATSPQEADTLVR